MGWVNLVAARVISDAMSWMPVRYRFGGGGTMQERGGSDEPYKAGSLSVLQARGCQCMRCYSVRRYLSANNRNLIPADAKPQAEYCRNNLQFIICRFLAAANLLIFLIIRPLARALLES